MHKEEVTNMQRVVLRGFRARAILALIVATTATALLTPGFDGSAHSAQIRPAHLCPPAC